MKRLAVLAVIVMLSIFCLTIDAALGVVGTATPKAGRDGLGFGPKIAGVPGCIDFPNTNATYTTSLCGPDMDSAATYSVFFPASFPSTNQTMIVSSISGSNILLSWGTMASGGTGSVTPLVSSTTVTITGPINYLIASNVTITLNTANGSDVLTIVSGTTTTSFPHSVGLQTTTAGILLIETYATPTYYIYTTASFTQGNTYSGGGGGGGNAMQACTDAENAVLYLGAWSIKWGAYAFNADSTHTVISATFESLSNPDSAPDGTLSLCIYTAVNSTTPGTQVGTCSNPVNRSSIAVGGGSVTFSGMSASLTNGTGYFLVLKMSTLNGYRIGVSMAVSCSNWIHSYSSSDDGGSTWVVQGSRDPRVTLYY